MREIQCVVVVVVWPLLCVTAMRMPANSAAAPIPIKVASENTGAAAPAGAPAGRDAAHSGRWSFGWQGWFSV